MPKLQRQVGFGTMGKDARRKLRRDNDIKILVVGKGSQTGIGKTTFAVQLCRFIDSTDEGWSAKEKAYIDVSEYIEAHQNKKKQSCLMLDEIEAGADSRRATSHENVNLSQSWATMRAKNIGTVATLPSVSMLDNRMLEMADYWVLVKARGVAQPYKVVVNDFNGRVQRKPINAGNNGHGEHITFKDLPSDDEDKKYLDGIKDDLVMSLTDDTEQVDAAEHKRKVKNTAEEARREKRDEAVCELYEKTEMSMGDLAGFDWVGVSQPRVSDILNGQ